MCAITSGSTSPIDFQYLSLSSQDLSKCSWYVGIVMWLVGQKVFQFFRKRGVKVIIIHLLKFNRSEDIASFFPLQGEWFIFER